MYIIQQRKSDWCLELPSQLLKMGIVILISLLTLTACSNRMPPGYPARHDSTTDSPTRITPSAPKTAEQKQQATQLAEFIVDAMYPTLTTKKEIIDDKLVELRVQMEDAAKNTNLDPCLLKAGIIDYTLSSLKKLYDAPEVRSKLIHTWSDKYTVEQLTKVKSFYLSSVPKKFSAAVAADDSLKNEPQKMKILYDRGALTEDDLKFLLVSRNDKDLNQFHTEAKEDFDSLFKLDAESMTKKFLEDNAVAIVKCDAPKGKG